MPDVTTSPTSAEVAREYFDRYPGLLHILRLGHATEETLGHAATLVRAALAAAPAEPSVAPSVAPGRPNLAVHVHLRDGSTRAIPYDCNIESPFQALERVYRHGDEHGPDFMVWDATHVTFSDGAAGRSVSPDDAHTETVTEWRAFGSPPADAWDLTGQGYVGESQVAAQTSALVLRRCGYADVRVESRTVTTSRRESEWKAADQ